MLSTCFILGRYVTYKFSFFCVVYMFGMLRLSQPASALKPPLSAVVMYSKSSSDPTSNGSTSSQGLLKNKTTRKILKKLVFMAIS